MSDNDPIMPLTEKCPVCKGNAKVRGVGNLLKTCDNCHATGYIRHTPLSDNKDQNVIKVKKKPGRPKSLPKKEDKPEFNTNQNIMVNSNLTSKSGLN